MTVKREKPAAVDEVARVLRIFNMIVDETGAALSPEGHIPGGYRVDTFEDAVPLLEIAERIAARTQD